MLNTIKTLIKSLSKNIVTKLTSVALLLVLLPNSGQTIKREDYQTEIVLNKNDPVEMLTIPERKVEIYSVGSRDDLNNLDTDAIKGIMKFYGEQYNIDWKLVYAIGYHESGNYTSSLARTNNNFFGRKAKSGGYASWATPEEGISDQFVYLQRVYFDRGLDTPARINPVYAEDSGWHYKVESVMAML